MEIDLTISWLVVSALLLITVETIKLSDEDVSVEAGKLCLRSLLCVNKRVLISLWNDLSENSCLSYLLAEICTIICSKEIRRWQKWAIDLWIISSVNLFIVLSCRISEKGLNNPSDTWRCSVYHHRRSK